MVRCVVTVFGGRLEWILPTNNARGLAKEV